MQKIGHGDAPSMSIAGEQADGTQSTAAEGQALLKARQHGFMPRSQEKLVKTGLERNGVPGDVGVIAHADTDHMRSSTLAVDVQPAESRSTTASLKCQSEALGDPHPETTVDSIEVLETSARDLAAQSSLPRNARDSLNPRPSPRKKNSGAFSWLTRNKSGIDGNTKPPSPQLGRRITAAPLEAEGLDIPMLNTTTDKNETLILSGSQNRRPNRQSLQDRFQLLRMRDELHNNATQDEHATGVDIDRTTESIHIDHLLASPDPETPAMQVELPSPPNKTTAYASSSSPTALGTAADVNSVVDWDLWQAVVNEGPQAFARTNTHELHRAISHGIPSAIRGVIWQVLAQSKNEDLEMVYRNLVEKGTEKDTMLAGALGRKAKRQDTPFTASELAKATGTNTSSTTSAYSETVSSHSVLISPAEVESLSEQPQDSSLDDATLSGQTKQVLDLHGLRKLERSIRRDLGARTSYSKFVMSVGLQDGLFGICKAYALYDEAVGYAQGMSFIAMPLLFNMSEEEAFCLFVRLMNKYNLRDMFTQEMPGLHLHLYQFERLLEYFEPALYCHLRRRGVSPHLYATQWFLTLFAYRFPLQLVLRIYDLVLSEGLESAILRFGIVLMRKNVQTLLGMQDMAALTTFLKEGLFDVYIDRNPSAASRLESGFFGSAEGIDKEVYRADDLIQDACAININPEVLSSYAGEWREITQDAKKKQAEEDTLRAGHASLSQQIRLFEARAAAHDAEHVELASQLVAYKVENQLLADTNESLMTRIAELQLIVDKQPSEVEAKLQSEMDRIMQRNIEVQNANRALEESVAEYEGELVDAKHQLAVVKEEFEEMKRKWKNIAGLVNQAKMT